MAYSMFGGLGVASLALTTKQVFWPKRCTDGWVGFFGTVWVIEAYIGHSVGFVPFAYYKSGESAVDAISDELATDHVMTKGYEWVKLHSLVSFV